MEEYGIQGQQPVSKFRHSCVAWYKNKHIAEMDGFAFDIGLHPKPPKNAGERLEQTKKKAAIFGKKVQMKAS
jgi:hypothetical protein